VQGELAEAHETLPAADLAALQAEVVKLKAEVRQG